MVFQFGMKSEDLDAVESLSGTFHCVFMCVTFSLILSARFMCDSFNVWMYSLGNYRRMHISSWLVMESDF